MEFTNKPLTDTTVDDARQVVEARFPTSALDVLDKTMKNPLRESCPEVGDIIYEDGRPVAFRAANRRLLFLGQDTIIGRVRGLTCRLRDSSKKAIDVLVEVQKANPRGCVLAFSNSQCTPTEKLALKYGATLGPESCRRFLWRPVRLLGCLLYILRRKVFRKPVPSGGAFKLPLNMKYEREGKSGVLTWLMIDPKFSIFDQLSESIRECNKGLIASRTAREMSWMFGDRVKAGTCAVLVTSVLERPVAAIVLTADSSGRRWLIADWCAVGNDCVLQETVLVAGCDFLRRHTPAIILETIGFPTHIQPLLKKYLPYVRPVSANWDSYNFIDPKVAARAEPIMDAKESWFFGPYDGDMCM